MMKEQLCTTVGMVGGFIAALLGGWDTGLQTDDFDRHRLPDWLDCGRSVPQVYKDEKRSTGKQGGIQRTLQKSSDFVDRADGVPVRYVDSCEIHT